MTQKRPDNYDDLLLQARALIAENGSPPRNIGKHRTLECGGMRCMEMHVLGCLNPPAMTGEDYISGPLSAGVLYGKWEIHTARYADVFGSFPAPFAHRNYTVDLSEALSPGADEVAI